MATHFNRRYRFTNVLRHRYRLHSDWSYSLIFFGRGTYQFTRNWFIKMFLIMLFYRLFQANERIVDYTDCPMGNGLNCSDVIGDSRNKSCICHVDFDLPIDFTVREFILIPVISFTLY